MGTLRIVCEDLWNEWQRCIKMVHTVLERHPADKWHEGENPFACPAGIAYHMVESIDFYIPDGIDHRLQESDMSMRVPECFRVTPFFEHMMGTRKNDIGKMSKF